MERLQNTISISLEIRPDRADMFLDGARFPIRAYSRFCDEEDVLELAFMANDEPLDLAECHGGQIKVGDMTFGYFKSGRLTYVDIAQSGSNLPVTGIMNAVGPCLEIELGDVDEPIESFTPRSPADFISQHDRRN